MSISHQIQKQILAVLLVLGQVFWGGGVVFAQTTSDEVLSPPTENTPPVDPIIIPDSSTISDVQGASSTPQLQETFTEQDTVDPTNTTKDDEVNLATTTDPTEDTPPPEDVSGGDATSTDDVATTTDEVPPTEDVTPPEETPPPTPDPVPTPEVVPPPPAPQQEPVISREELKPSPKYMFAINGSRHISASRRAHRQERDKKSGKMVMTEVTEVASAPPAITVDNTNGVMNISGSCSDPYYVILVYKNESDYATAKNLAIVNRAFPCEGGAYSYNLGDLPSTLEDGTYYLLVAGMGDNTPWQPITSLTEIQLHRN